MNNLPLQPLVWRKQNTDDERIFVEHAQGAGIFYTVYGAMNDGFGTRWHDQMEGSHGKKEGFWSIAEIKHWVETEHYPHKMQPYVKPSPTWIDAKKQLPQVDKDTQFICAYYSAIEPYVKTTYFDTSLNEFDYEHGSVIAWMPIPEFSTMQILHKGE